jgi:hypothetical protein
MTTDDIIRMAREAHLAEPYHPYHPWSASQEALERFAALVAEAEREACARVCDWWNVSHCAACIRARGDEVRADEKGE